MAWASDKKHIKRIEITILKYPGYEISPTRKVYWIFKVKL